LLDSLLQERRMAKATRQFLVEDYVDSFLPIGEEDLQTELSPKKEVECDSLIQSQIAEFTAVFLGEEDGSVDIKEECVEEKDPLSTTSQSTKVCATRERSQRPSNVMDVENGLRYQRR